MPKAQTAFFSYDATHSAAAETNNTMAISF